MPRNQHASYFNIKRADYTGKVSQLSNLTCFAQIFAELTRLEYSKLLSHNDYMASELPHVAVVTLVA